MQRAPAGLHAAGRGVRGAGCGRVPGRRRVLRAGGGRCHRPVRGQPAGQQKHLQHQGEWGQRMERWVLSHWPSTVALERAWLLASAGCQRRRRPAHAMPTHLPARARPPPQAACGPSCYADLDARLEAYLNANAAALGASPNATFKACAGGRGPGGQAAQAGRLLSGRQQQVCPAVASRATSTAPAALARTWIIE